MLVTEKICWSDGSFFLDFKGSDAPVFCDVTLGILCIGSFRNALQSHWLDPSVAAVAGHRHAELLLHALHWPRAQNVVKAFVV